MRLIIIIYIFLGAGILSAQNDSDRHERIKALKTAFITEGLELTPAEAEKFWPIYNRFEEKRRELYRREHADLEDVECLSEEKAEEKLQEYVSIEKEDYLLKQQYYRDLRKIFSAKRIMELQQVEEEFHDKLMRDYRSRKQQK